MKHLLLILSFIFSFSTFAKSEHPACRDFKKIKALKVKLTENQVDRILYEAEWLEDKYRMQDYQMMGYETAKTIFLVAINHLTVYTYAFTSGRAEAPTRTGYFIRNPKNFAEFLEESPETACFYLSMTGPEAQILQELTQETWRVFESVNH